jgi:hypothetical protein
LLFDNDGGPRSVWVVDEAAQVPKEIGEGRCMEHRMRLIWDDGSGKGGTDGARDARCSTHTSSTRR